MFRKMTDNIMAVSRETEIPHSTIRNWIRAGKIELPRDIDLFKRIKRNNGQWYLQVGPEGKTRKMKVQE
jgi:hypothetical protein